MNDERSYQVAAKALRNFGIPEQRIQALNRKRASWLLTQLIQRARSNPTRDASNDKNDRTDALNEGGNLSDATNLVMEHLGIKDKSRLSEAHIALIQGTSRQIYGLKYWIGRSNGNLRVNND